MRSFDFKEIPFREVITENGKVVPFSGYFFLATCEKQKSARRTGAASTGKGIAAYTFATNCSSSIFGNARRTIGYSWKVSSMTRLEMPGNNSKKTEMLGMPFGTACGRLRKRIMLRLLQRLNDDVCFKCGRKIETVEELSIEHKRPWFGVDAVLFWDLENIAFSHLACNRPERHAGIANRKIGPTGTAWCTRHKEFVPVTLFKRDTSRWNGLSDYCTPCHSKRQVERRLRNGLR